MPHTANLAALRRQADLDGITAGLICEVDHPRFPGWQGLALLLMAATVATAVASHQADLRQRDQQRGTLPLQLMKLGRVRAAPNGVRLVDGRAAA